MYIYIYRERERERHHMCDFPLGVRGQLPGGDRRKGRAKRLGKKWTWEPEFPPSPPLRSRLHEIRWGLHKAGLRLPPQRIRHTGPVIVGMVIIIIISSSSSIVIILSSSLSLLSFIIIVVVIVMICISININIVRGGWGNLNSTPLN